MMEDIMVLIGFVLGLITALGITIGFDLRTRRGWLIILCGFISGFLIGSSIENLISGLVIGALAALGTLVTGTAMFRINRNRG